MKFQLGQTVATPGVLRALTSQGMTGLELLKRHILGDWGDLNDEDKLANEQALKDGSRILSAYKINDEVKVWIITESDRSVTTILLPEEY